MTELQSKVELYVPGTVQISYEADTSGYVTRVAASFSQWFGGATVSEVTGYYIAETTGALISERTRIVWSYCTTEQLEMYSPEVLALAGEICHELQQECVAVVINGIMFLVPDE